MNNPTLPILPKPIFFAASWPKFCTKPDLSAAFIKSFGSGLSLNCFTKFGAATSSCAKLSSPRPTSL